MKVVELLKTEIQRNAAWPFAIVFILVNEVGKGWFHHPSVLDFLVSAWFIPTFLITASFITYLFLLGFISYYKKYVQWIPPERYLGWKVQVALGAAMVITMESSSIGMFFLCLFQWTVDGKANDLLQSWLYADMVYGLVVVPVICKVYFWRLKKQF